MQGIRQDIEIIRKPFVLQTLVDKIEDKEIYTELEKFNVDIDCIKAADFRHDQLRDIVLILKKGHKNQTKKVMKPGSRKWNIIHPTNKVLSFKYLIHIVGLRERQILLPLLSAATTIHTILLGL
jgi:hypothetical protein